MVDIPAIPSARPALFINGELQPELGLNLQTLLVEETSAGLARCQARFMNWGTQGDQAGFVYFDSGLLAFGALLSVEIGEGRGQGRIFEGRISALEGLYPDGQPPAIVVYAEDRLEELRQTRRTRGFEDTSCMDVINEIAGEHGLLVQAAAGGGDPVQDVIAQVEEADLAFLRRLARRIQADLWLEGETLTVQPRSAAAGDLSLAWGAGLISFQTQADLAGQVTTLGVAGWDPAAKTAIEETATDAVMAAEVGGGLSGAAIVQAVFGDRAVWLGREVPLSAPLARALAESRYAERARRFVTGTGTTIGDARLRVGRTVTLEGLGAWFDGEYSLSAVRHTFDPQQGVVTAFSVERPFLLEAAISARGKGKHRPLKALPKRKPARPAQERPDLAETKVHQVPGRPRKGSDPRKTEQMDMSGKES